MKTKEEVLAEIQLIFRDVFKDENLMINFASNSNSISGWDSITNILLIDKIEENYNIEFPIDVIYESENIEDWINFIRKS